MKRDLQAGDSVTRAVSDAISTLEVRPVESLRPLSGGFRRDLDAIFDFDDSGPQTGLDVRVTFEYMDYHVTVETDGTLSVERKPE